MKIPAFLLLTLKPITFSIGCLIMVCLLTICPRNVSGSEASAVEWFFADCPSGRYYRLHHENEKWDLHEIFYETAALAEVEVLRIADWIIDLPILGRPIQPFVRTVRIIRSEYNALPQWVVTRRLGEFVDAWQIPELSIGAASTTYSVAIGGNAGPGSGMLIRVNKLVDWTQHVIGDTNDLLGWMIKRPFMRLRHKYFSRSSESTPGVNQDNHLINWSFPGDIVDGTQWTLIKTFNGITIFTARVVEGLISGVEKTGEVIINFGHHPPHREETVFIRLPKSVFSAHKEWFLKKHHKIIAGTQKKIAASTHAQLAHQSSREDTLNRNIINQFLDQKELIMMMKTSVFSSAPEVLEAYVIPASWVFDSD